MPCEGRRYASDYEPGYTPLILPLSHAVLQSRLQRVLNASAGQRHTSVVLLTRGQGGRARSMLNQDSLVVAIQSEFPWLPRVDVFEPGIDLQFMEVMARVHRATVIIGPHGANLNNIVGARPGSAVVELGYPGGGMTMPSDFFCLARNLGLSYWLSPSIRGDYGSPMEVDVQDVLGVLHAVLD